MNWHLAALSRDASSADFAYFRGASVSRILEEEFSSPLLRGLLAQLCLAGCSVSPSLPGSAMLMLRHSLLALLGSQGAGLLVLDSRAPEEMLYDAGGLPK